jgi:sugar (pentulose or hexulose) kinase
VTAGAESRAVWLGLDIGTQGCRAVAIAADGRQLARAQAPLVSVREADRHEQDPAAWVAGACASLAEVTQQASTDEVRGIAICGTSGTMLIADDDLRPLTCGLMYDDARAADRAVSLANVWADCAARNGYRIQPTWALAKLSWLFESLPEIRQGRAFFVGDYLGSWLAGAPVAADCSHALKAGYDLVRDCWPEAEFERAGIAADVLPPVVRPGTVVGAVGKAAASMTGLPVGTPIVAGMTDGCASQIAAGAVRPGDWNSALGTTLVLKGVSSSLVVDPDGAVYSHRHPDGTWLPGGASSSGGGALTAALPDIPATEVDRIAEPLIPTRLVTYPIATPGERFPFVRADAEPFRSAEPASDAELAASLLQGVAFVERLCLAHLADLGADTSGSISFTGGATRSGLWNQLRADVLARPIRLPKNADAAAGMAVLAASSGRTVAETASAMVSDYRTVEPRESGADTWTDRYLTFVDELDRRGYISRSLASAARAA